MENDQKHALSRIPLRWMVRECFRTGTGIRFHAELLKDIGLDPATLNAPSRPPALEPAAHHLPRAADPPVDAKALADWPEERHEVHDALAQVYDQLAAKWYKWWPLECFPTHAEDGALLWCVSSPFSFQRHVWMERGAEFVGSRLGTV